MYSILMSKFNEGFYLIEEQLKKIINKNSNIVIIPWSFATELKSKNIDEFFDETKKNSYLNHLYRLGVKEKNIKILDCYNDNKEDMIKEINNSNAIILTGGNQEMLYNKIIENGLLETLNKLVNSKFTRIDHEEVIRILKEAKVKWEFQPEYGQDIAREHEKYITEYFNGPVFIKNWPKDIKAFYMKQNTDGKTVAAVDLEVPGAGELMGGSQREEDYDKLVNRMQELGMKQDELDWYLNLRKFGGCVHSGFGMGFERLIIYLTGVDNIRDVIPYPRTPGNCDY